MNEDNKKKMKALNCDVIAQNKKRRRESVKSAEDQDKCTKKARKSVQENTLEKKNVEPELQTLTPYTSDNPGDDTPPPVRRDSVPVFAPLPFASCKIAPRIMRNNSLLHLFKTDY